MASIRNYFHLNPVKGELTQTRSCAKTTLAQLMACWRGETLLELWVLVSTSSPPWISTSRNSRTSHLTQHTDY